MEKKRLKRKNYPTKLDRLNIKVPPRVREHLQTQADRYCRGNISMWLRIAGCKYVPPKKA